MLVRNVIGAKNRVAFAHTELIGLSSPPNRIRDCPQSPHDQ